MTKLFENEQSKRLFEMLANNNYRRLWSHSATENSHIEAWAGYRGVLLIQVWKRDGVDIYHSAGVPSRWQDLDEWLNYAQDPKEAP